MASPPSPSNASVGVSNVGASATPETSTVNSVEAIVVAPPFDSVAVADI